MTLEELPRFACAEHGIAGAGTATCPTCRDEDLRATGGRTPVCKSTEPVGSLDGVPRCMCDDCYRYRCVQPYEAPKFRDTLFRWDGQDEERARITILGAMMLELWCAWHEGRTFDALAPMCAASRAGFSTGASPMLASLRSALPQADVAVTGVQTG